MLCYTSVLRNFRGLAVLVNVMIARPQPYIRWTEAELHDEIRHIGDRIQQKEHLRDERSRCATAYLVQLLRDREQTLATLVARRRQH